MKQKHSKRTHSFHLAGAMMLVSLPYTATAIYASEETEIVESIDDIDPTNTNQPANEGESVLDHSENNNDQEVQTTLTDLPEEPKEVEQSEALLEEDKKAIEQETKKEPSVNEETLSQETLNSTLEPAKEVDVSTSKAISNNITSVSTQSVEVSTNSLQVQAADIDLNSVIEIPEEEMIIVDGIYYGISKAWYDEINPDHQKLSFSLTLPDRVIRIAKEGFNDMYTPDKEKYGCFWGDESTIDTKYVIKTIDFANTDPIIEVPDEGIHLNIYNAYLGISTEWYEKINPGGSKDIYNSKDSYKNNVHSNGRCLKLSLTIPETVTRIMPKAFFEADSGSSKQSDWITAGMNESYYKGKIYRIVNIDFSKATNLQLIEASVADGCTWLEGIVDLSNAHAKLTVLSSHAFAKTGITGVILPKNLKTMGGYVFHGCENLRFVRTAGGDPNSNFELPTTLTSLGGKVDGHCFADCMGLPDNTIVSIPASVTEIGQSTFSTPKITTIFVNADSGKNYHKDAFIAYNTTHDYGLGKRMTIFKNYSARNSFNNGHSFDYWRFDDYDRSLTFEYTLYYYGTDQKETKLFGQPTNVCKNEEGIWYENLDYTLPEIAGNSTWITGSPLSDAHGPDPVGPIVETNTYLGRAGDILVLFNTMSIQFVVDGIKIPLDDTRLDPENNHIKLNLSDDSKHTIGVEIASPSPEFSELEFKFEYEWLDIKQDNSLGFRTTKRETGFDKYSETYSTISIQPFQDERTIDENYHFTQGYYQLAIKGSFHLIGAWANPTVFYQSQVNHYADPANDAFVFFIITSPPTLEPEGEENHGNVIYGEYDKAEIGVDVKQEENHSYTYQWYEVPVEERQRSKVIALSDESELDSSNWIQLEEETSALQIASGKNAGNYIYYLAITSSRENDQNYISFDHSSKTRYFTLLFTVNKAQSEVQFLTDNLDKVYNEQAVSASAVENKGNTNDVTYTWYEYDGENWIPIDQAPTDAGIYQVIARIEEDTNYKDHQTEALLFEISKATPNPKVQLLTIKQGNELSSLELPEGFAWENESEKANELGIHFFNATFTPNDTRNYEVLDVEVPVNVVMDMVALNQAPTIEAKDITLPFGQEFTNDIALQDVKANDAEDGDLTNKIEVIQNTVDPSKAGVYSLTYKVTDKDGASATKTITVTVNPKVEENMNEAPRIDAQDMILMVGDPFDPKHGVSATDKEDGDLTDKIEIVQNTVDSSKAGSYIVSYKVTDKDGASATKTITVTIKAVEEKPTKPDDNNGINNDSNKTDPTPVIKPNKVDSTKPNKVDTATTTVTKSNRTENVATPSLLEENHSTATKESPYTAVESIQSTSSFAWSLAALPLLKTIKTFFKRKRTQ